MLVLRPIPPPPAFVALNQPLPPTIQSSSTATDPYGRALEFLYDRLDYERQTRGAAKYAFRLHRITDLLRRLDLDRYLHRAGQPPAVPLIHLAGTKGKGSTATMVSSVLTAAGYRNGLYSSPHLHCLEERFRVDGQPCTSQQLIELVDRASGPVIEMEKSVGPPSFFELTTALALLHFDSVDCRAIVMEVGLGGRLDSTNVCSPSVTCVTSIGLDHQHVLGQTLPEIAAEKAGIIKPGIPVVSGVTDPASVEVIRARAESQGAPLFQLGEHFDVHCQPNADWGSSVTVQGHTAPLAPSHQMEVAMEGEHQARNAAIAAVVFDLLRDKGMKLDEAALRAGVAASRCPGRIERWALSEDRIAIVDSAHNEDSIDALCKTLAARCAGRPITLVFGTSIDKSVEPMLERLAQVASRLVLTRFLGNPRFREPNEIRPLVPNRIASVTEVVQDPIQACQTALAKTPPGGVLAICGSFFLAAETRKWVQEQNE